MSEIFTIIICCYNSSERILRVIENIVKQEKFNQLVKNIIIVNNNSNDDTNEYIKKSKEVSFKVIDIFEEKPGLSNARKTGVINCDTEWIIFLDDDNFLDNKWLENAYQYIEKSPKVGAFNGAIIPRTADQINEEERERLFSSLKVLACTHKNKEELSKNKKSPFKNPIGAGLVIKSEPLKKLCDIGWLKSPGRMAGKLTSGEDGEMAHYVKKMGYDFGFCSNMILKHEIPKFRLQDDYLNTMWYEIGVGVAIIIKNSKFSKLKDICYRALLYFRLFIKKFNKNRYNYKYYVKYIQGYKIGYVK